MENTNVTDLDQKTGFEFTQGNNPWGVDFKKDIVAAEAAPESPPILNGEDQIVNTQDDPIITPATGDVTTEEALVDDSDILGVDNPVFFLAKQALADGFLPQADISKDITLNDFYESYKESIKPRAEQEILSKVEERLESAGIREEHLILLQAIENGVPPDELSVVSRFQKYSVLDTDQAPEDKKLEVIKEWYTSRNLSPKEIARNLEAISINDEVETEFEEAKSFFGETVKNYADTQRTFAKERQEQIEATQRRNLDFVKSLPIKLEISGEKITPTQAVDLQKSIFDRSKTVKVDGGNKVNMSPYEEFMYNLNNNLEFSLLHFKRALFRDKEVAIQLEEVKEKTNKDFLDAYKTAQDKSSLKGSVKRTSSDSGNDNGNVIIRTPGGGARYEFSA